MSDELQINREEELITIFVETLTGTIFEIKVCPKDEVKSIKLQIQKEEGIPVIHQHLVYNSKELDDALSINDSATGLRDQTTIRLILTMRGGPISLVHQMVPFNKSLLKNLVQLDCDILKEELPPGCKMAILVLKVGDKVNFLQVIDDDSDEIDPLDYLSNETINEPFNLFRERKPNLVEENSVTTKKVSDLKERLNKLSLQRKLQRVTPSKENKKSASLLQVEPVNNSSTSSKLPSISLLPKSKELVKTRSEFSKAPILPDIIRQPMGKMSKTLKFTSLDSEFHVHDICETFRPKTCPGSFQQSTFLRRDSLCQLPPQSHHRSCVSATFKIHCCHKDESETEIAHCLPPLKQTTALRSSNHLLTRNKLQRISLETVNITKRKCRVDQQITLGSLHQPISKDPKTSFVKKTSTSISSNSNEHSNKSLMPIKTRQSSNSLLTKIPFPSKEPINLQFKNSEQNQHKIDCIKRSRLKCSECRKKLTLTSTFECRCGLIFCSNHRYSETHQCTYDFKTEGRKIIEEANPSVVAPKLPKI